MRKIVVLALTMVATGAGPAPARAIAAWTVYADCAAAYMANARLADPDRPAAMTSQISDVANDYSAAAAKRRRERLGGSAAASRRAVEVRVERQGKVFAARPREAVEHVIDACPQLDG